MYECAKYAIRVLWFMSTQSEINHNCWHCPIMIGRVRFPLRPQTKIIHQ
nr:MAG TPA: hypothetical protein [Caudoviricetes sp.]